MTGSPEPLRFVRRHLGQSFGASLFLFGGVAMLVIGVTTALEERRYAREGDTGTIRYDRTRPADSIWLGRA